MLSQSLHCKESLVGLVVCFLVTRSRSVWKCLLVATLQEGPQHGSFIPELSSQPPGRICNGCLCCPPTGKAGSSLPSLHGPVLVYKEGFSSGACCVCPKLFLNAYIYMCVYTHTFYRAGSSGAANANVQRTLRQLRGASFSWVAVLMI